MKLLVIDTDSDRIQLLKTLEGRGHLVQPVPGWEEASGFLNHGAIQMLVVGPQAGAGVGGFIRSASGESQLPLIVGMGPGVEGIDYLLAIPLEEKEVAALPILPRVPPEPEPIDYYKALDICDGDSGLFREVVQIFLGDGPRRMDMLETGYANRDWKTVAEAAHLMKGSSLNLAAKPLLQVTRHLEKAGDAAQSDAVDFWYGQMRYEYQRLVEHLTPLAKPPQNP